MSTVQEIRVAMTKLSREEMIELRNLLDDIVEENLEITDQFKASIERGMTEIAEGRGRVRQPEA